jgi:plastocyanin
MKKLLVLLFGLCVVAALATACGGSTATSQKSETATASGGATITIANFSFGDPITVSPGAPVTINNTDSVEHSVTSDTAGKFDTDVDGKESKTFTAPSEPAEYAFHCTYHKSMKGTLIVK